MTDNMFNYVHKYQGTHTACGLKLDSDQIVGINKLTEMIGTKSRLRSTTEPDNVTCPRCELALKKGNTVIDDTGLRNFQSLILAWARKRGILDHSNTKSQCLKFIEEAGELSQSVNYNDLSGIQDGIGDTIITLIVLAYMNNMCIEDCLDAAWDKIRGREGSIVNGVFKKRVEK